MFGVSLLLLAALPGAPAGGALRFETGRHTAAVRGIVRDPASGDWISVGDDKTVRRWRDGHSAGPPLRFATGGDANGRFPCCAVSRSGLLAVGDHDQDHPSVWLVDLTKGASAPVRRIAIERKDRENDAATIFSVAFSADGKLLAAGDDAGTLRVWNAADGTRVAERRLAGKDWSVFSVAFAPTGGRVAYVASPPNHEAGATARSIAGVVEAAGGSAKATEIKVGENLDCLVWADPATLVLGGEHGTLERWKIGEPTARKTETGIFNPDVAVSAVAATPDGKGLVAGTNNGDLLLYDAAASAPRTVKLAPDESEVWAVGLAPDGKTVVAGLGNGEVCEVEFASGKPSRILSPASPRVTEIRWSADGGALRWKADGRPTGFDLVRSTPSVEGPDAGIDGHQLGGQSVSVEHNAVVVKGSSRWKGRLDLGDVAYDAVFLDENRLLVATSAGLELCAASGTTLVDAGDPRSLARSPDGARVAVGFADGLVRLYSCADIQSGPVASIYLNGGEWVGWQEATGQYDSSPGGDRIFGYQVNRRDDELASFVPAIAKETDYRRPGFLASLLGLGAAPPPPKPMVDLASAVARAASFRVVGVERGQATDDGFQVEGNTALVRIRVDNPEEETISLRVGHGGLPRNLDALVNVSRDDPSAQICRVSDLAPGTNLVQVYVGDRPLPGAEFRIESVQPDAPKTPSRLLVLAIGVSRYADPAVRTLPSAVGDATSFVQAVRENFSGEGELTVMPIYDADATRAGIEKGLDWLKATADRKRGDRVMVFVASHGNAVQDGPTYIAPYDYVVAEPAKRGMPWSDVAERLAAVQCQSLVLFSDNCFSGAAVGAALKAAPRQAGETMRGLATQMAVFAACTGEQVSREYTELKHGLFTYALLRGMLGEGGWVNPNTGEVTTDMLRVAVPITMERWQKDNQVGNPQVPVILLPTGTIPVTRPKAKPRGGA